MRILYVINSLNIGGAEKLCVDLIKKSKKRGILIDLYLLNNQETELRSELVKENINIFSSTTNNYKSYKHIIWLIKNSKKYDVIHSHLSYSQYYVSVLRIFNRKLKLITTEHSTFNERRNLKIFKFIEKFMYGQYSKIIVINNENLKSIIQWQKSIKNKVIVINNGIDIKKYSRGNKNNIKDERLLRIKDKNKILMIAAFRKEKNHKLMLNVLKKLDEKNVLILLGDGESSIKNYIKEFISENNLENRVIMLGNRNDVEDIINFCDIAVLPSMWEGFGLVAVECMAGGLPIVGSNVKGLSEVINNKDLLFNKNDKDDLTRKICCLLNDSYKKESVIKYCIEKSKEYDIEKTLDRYLKLYQE
ncbi:glycosyltransferase family 4 protein [Clostridium baratii]|uniref:glycosyltransferase family 4 protein n=1 Tax=Clostridium baratii TaxID=1561 RepID=UPI003D337D21